MAAGFSVKDMLNSKQKAGVADEAPKARFRTKDISIFKIYENEGNFYPQEGIEQKATEIRAIGLLQNLVVKYQPCDKGEYELIAGERRWRALKRNVELGYKEFEVVTCNVIAPTTTHEEKIAEILSNSYRNKKIVTILQEERELKATLDDMRANNIELKGYNLQGGRLRDVIAELLNMSKTKVAQIEAVNNNLIPEWIAEIKNERLTFSAAYELSGMSEEQQKEVFEKYKVTGEIAYKEIKDMKEAKAAVQPEEQTKDTRKTVSESDTEEIETHSADNTDEWEEAEGTDEAEAAVEEYQTPHPEGITSLCYSCTKYETCNVKTGTCTKCDQYKNRAEAYKTDEQRYSEEQDRIDRETRKRLREKEQEEKMQTLPSEAKENKQDIHQIRQSPQALEEVISGKRSFQICKKWDNYKVGDILEMSEFKDGKYTGKSYRAVITYVLNEHSGITGTTCILAFNLLNEYDEPLNRVDIKRICEDIQANGDGYIEGGEEYILIDKALSIVQGGSLE